MDFPEAFLIVGLGAYPILAGWGWIVVNRGNFTAARLCFWAGTIWLGVATIMFGMAAKWPILDRLIFAGVIGAVLSIGLTEGLRWVTAEAAAQNIPPSSNAPPTGKKTLSSDSGSDHVVGASIVGNSQGGPAAEIISTGAPSQPSIGADIRATGVPGQSVTGLSVTQTGPGTGLKVIQNGPGVGLRVTVGVKPDGAQ